MIYEEVESWASENGFDGMWVNDFEIAQSQLERNRKMANIVIKPWQEKILVMEIIIIYTMKGKSQYIRNRIFILEIKLKLRFGGIDG